MSESQAVGAADEYCITVIRDEDNQLGKRFLADGTKQAAVSITDGAAQTVRCETPAELADVIRYVSQDPNMAIVLAHFGIPPGEEFRLLSRDMMRGALIATRGLPADHEFGDDELDGVHEFPDSTGQTVKAVCRTKANASSSVWILVDRDIDDQTPPQFAGLSHDEFIVALDTLLPGISQTTRVQTLSSSARVTPAGQPVGSKAGHTFVRLSHAVDRAQLKAAVRARALASGMAWLVNKYSRAQPGQVVAQDWRLLLDDSVLSVERLVFCGAPTADEGSGLVVHDQQVEVIAGSRVAVDPDLCTPPPAEAVATATRAAGREVRASGLGGGSAAFRVATLQADTLIETREGFFPLSHIANGLRPGGKVRCQAPFRESSSWAAFVGVTERGEPFVYDSGTSTSYFVEVAPVTDVQAMLRAAAARQAPQVAAEPEEELGGPPAAIARAIAAQPVAKTELARAPELSQAIVDGMPRVMRRCWDWMLDTAHRPQPELAFAASLALMAVVLGTKVRTPSGLRTNLYVVSTAVTGGGKEHGRSCLRKVLAAAGLGHLEGGEPASGQAIMSRLADNPNTILQLDEFGLLMQACKDAKSPRYSIIKTLLEMTGAASSSVPGTMYSDTKARESKTVSFPCLTIHGTSTPETLYSALTGGDLASGLLNRVLLVESNATMSTDLTLQARPDIDAPPEDVVRWVKAVAVPDVQQGTSLVGVVPSAPAIVKPIELAERTFASAGPWLKGAVAIAAERGMADLWSRFGALAAQLALIHACADLDAEDFADARRQDALTIGPQSAAWAIAVAKHCMLRMEQILVSNLSSTDHEALQKRILMQLKKTGSNKDGEFGGPGGHRVSQLLNDRFISGASPRDRNDAIQTLMDAGRIYHVEFWNTKTRRTRKALVLAEHLDESAIEFDAPVPGAPSLVYRHVSRGKEVILAAPVQKEGEQWQ